MFPTCRPSSTPATPRANDQVAVSSSAGSTSVPETGTPAEGSTAGVEAHQPEGPPALSNDQPAAKESGPARPGDLLAAKAAAAPCEPLAAVEGNGSLSKEPEAEADDMFHMDEVSRSRVGPPPLLGSLQLHHNLCFCGHV